jgi:hypothetical protein
MNAWMRKVLGATAGVLGGMAFSAALGDTPMLAHPRALALEIEPSVVLPPSLYLKPHPFTFSDTGWSKFEANHAITPESGFLAQPFYELCVTTQQLKMWQKEMHQVFHEFDRGMSETFFGSIEPRNSLHQTTDDAFFGKPQFQTILPLDDPVDTTQYRSRLSGVHHPGTVLIGIQIVIPLGQK